MKLYVVNGHTSPHKHVECRMRGKSYSRRRPSWYLVLSLTYDENNNVVWLMIYSTREFYDQSVFHSDNSYVCNLNGRTRPRDRERKLCLRRHSVQAGRHKGRQTLTERNRLRGILSVPLASIRERMYLSEKTSDAELSDCIADQRPRSYDPPPPPTFPLPLFVCFTALCKYNIDCKKIF